MSGPQRGESAPSPARKRTADQTRQDILLAAGRQFARAGFGTVRLRDIAADAGVTAPLVLRYFGSKEALFREVTEDESGPTIEMADLAGPLETLGARLAAVMVPYWAQPRFHFPSIALIRSLDFEEAKTIFTKEYTRRLIEPLTEALPGPDAELRARLLAAQIMGVGMFGLGVLLEPEAAAPGKPELDRLIAVFGAALQATIDSVTAGSASPR